MNIKVPEDTQEEVKEEVFKYLVAGGLAFATDFTVLYLATEHLGLHYLLSNVLGYCCGFVVTYLLNTRWVFKHRRFAERGQEFGLFVLIVLTGLALNEMIMAALVSFGGVYYLWAKVFATLLVMVFNFLAKKFILFSPPASANHA